MFFVYWDFEGYILGPLTFGYYGVVAGKFVIKTSWQVRSGCLAFVRVLNLPYSLAAFLGHCLLAVGSNSHFLTFGIVLCRSYSAHCSIMSVKEDITSTSAADKGKKCGRIGTGTDRTNSKKPTELFTECEFREHFHILNGISIHLVDGDPTSTENEFPSAIFF